MWARCFRSDLELAKLFGDVKVPASYMKSHNEGCFIEFLFKLLCPSQTLERSVAFQAYTGADESAMTTNGMTTMA